MNKPGGRRNAELEAWDRELRKTTGGDDEGAAGGEEPREGSSGGRGGEDPHASASPPERSATSPEIPAGVADPPPAGTDARTGAASAGAPPPADPVEPPTPGGGDTPPPAPWSSADDGVTTEVLLRDLIIFQVKLLLDGLKDVVLSPLAIAAVLWDLVPSRTSPRGRAFYQVLKVGERFDLWLNLYNPSHAVRKDHEGLLEAGAHSADSLMGKLEQLARAEAEKKGGWQGVGTVTPLGGKAKKGNDLEG